MELGTPGAAVRLASVARHITDCVTQPGILLGMTLNDLFIFIFFFYLVLI